ncbi:MAG: hypothetical protein IPO18_11200 [bacterium]|nr:hypothetical protein [bacterium]
MQRRSCFALTGLMISLALAMAGPALATTVTFQDGTFTNAQWTTTVEVLNGGGSVNAFQVASGGNPTAFRRIENTLNSAIGTGVSNTVYGFHRFAGGVYDPATGGPILAINYAEDSQRISGGVQACGLAVRQAGVIYYGPAFLTPTAFGTWATTTQSALVAGQFDALAPGVQNPDFSVAGAPLEFGFWRGNSTSVGGGGGTTYGGIDNWRVDLTVDAAVAAETTTWGEVKALFRAGVVAR